MKKNKAEKLFSTYARKWIAKTGLGMWKIDIVYLGFKEYSELEDVDNPHCSVALCRTNWQYFDAKIYVNSKVLKRVEKSDIEYVVLHELMHILLNEMRAEGIEHEERVATLLARSFITAFDKKGEARYRLLGRRRNA